ncbi:hypothetical protein T03_888 [Trichinella britovi]|uniref:Uncharacterized protein n=1 Tax=Trichinella britovi TaxID=45882 RepID=A0A0V1C411_TRIBR|nr:hypothetical protein T03_888 [Trichinella britovi]
MDMITCESGSLCFHRETLRIFCISVLNNQKIAK